MIPEKAENLQICKGAKYEKHVTVPNMQTFKVAKDVNMKRRKTCKHSK